MYGLDNRKTQYFAVPKLSTSTKSHSDMHPVLSPLFFPPRFPIPALYVLSTKENEDQEKDT